MSGCHSSGLTEVVNTLGSFGPMSHSSSTDIWGHPTFTSSPVSNPAPAPDLSGSQHPPVAAPSAADINRAWESTVTSGAAAVAHASYLTSAAATQRYAQFPEEIAALYRRLEHVKGKLAEMGKVVDRFEAVKVPVVASDGFTYDKPLLQAYFAECRAQGVVVLSHQNQQELRDLTIPNNSLTKLLEQLRPLVNPVVEPPLIAARSAAHPPSPSSRSGSWREQPTSN
jgi:hypothetical protein